jgi:hypothetical protein
MVDWLPPEGKKRFEALQEVRDQSEAKLRALMPRRAKIDGELNDLNAVRRRLPEDYPAPRRLELDKRISVLEFEVEEWEREYKKRQERHFADSQIVIHAREFAETLPPHEELADHYNAPSLGHRGDVANVRHEIDQLKRAILSLRNAPPPVAELAQAAAEQIRGMAFKGAPRIDMRGGKLSISFDGLDMATPLGLLQFAAWFDAQKLAERLVAEMTPLMRNGNGGLYQKLTGDVTKLSAAERKQKLAELEDRLLGHERWEEELILTARRDDQDIARRWDCDPRAVLGVSVKARAERAVA